MKKTARRIICLTLTSTLLASASAGATTATGEADVKISRYTRLNVAGKAISAESGPASCVRDNETGFVWELKTDDGGIHDKDTSYRWGGTGAEAIGSLFFDDWNSLLDSTNQETLCGFDDWRIPAIDELKSLIRLNRAEPTIDTEYFPHTLANPYWSSSAYANYPEHGQNVDFGNGNSYYYSGYRGNHLPLRLVRGKARR